MVKISNQAINLWDKNVDVMFAPHHWPIWDKKHCKSLNIARDMYRFINDQTLYFANQGFTMEQIAEKIELPEKLELVS